MKRFRWQIVLGLTLIGLSAALYLAHYAIFHDAHHIMIYLVGDIAFVPLEVLLVTIIIHRLLEVREKNKKIEKLNMVIGAFFSETGTELLRFLAGRDTEAEKLRDTLHISGNWDEAAFRKAAAVLSDHPYRTDMTGADLESLYKFLAEKRNFQLGLLGNPTLLEHDAFTDALWAVLHLTEELGARSALTDLPESDRHHLQGDVQRAYGRVTLQWVNYMRHLKRSYPYLFSLAMRTNPFNPQASPVVVS